MIGETVIRVRSTPGGTDPYGDPIDGTLEELPIEHVAVEPRRAGAGEPSERGRQGVIVGLTAYLPAGSPEVLFTDQLRVRGVLYDVEGEPGDWRDPFIAEPAGVELQLKRAEG